MAKLNYRLQIAKQQSDNLCQIKDEKIRTLNNLCRVWNYISGVTVWRQQNLFVKCFVPPKQQWQLFASEYLIWVGDRLFKVFEKKGIFFLFFFTRVESYFTTFKYLQIHPGLKKKAHPKDYARCVKPQIPWGLFIFNLRKQSIWWLPERGQCAFVLITSNTVCHCLKNNFLSKKLFWLSFG